jgi:hypothetical protein
LTRALEIRVNYFPIIVSFICFIRFINCVTAKREQKYWTIFPPVIDYNNQPLDSYAFYVMTNKHHISDCALNAPFARCYGISILLAIARYCHYLYMIQMKIRKKLCLIVVMNECLEIKQWHLALFSHVKLALI